MQSTLEVLFTPADFRRLSTQDIRGATCLVFDVLRATTSMIEALHHGAIELLPVSEIPEAISIFRQRPDCLLAGERDGFRISASVSGAVDFHMGNSPREFGPALKGRTLVITTTNGTRALQACSTAHEVVVGCMRNLGAVCRHLEEKHPERLIVVCAGTYEEPAYEDVLAAGAVCDALWPIYGTNRASDGAQMVREIYQGAKSDLLGAVSRSSKNARRLLKLPELADDVSFCFDRDARDFPAFFSKGSVHRAL